MNWDKAKVLITGGYGFLGRNIIDRLIEIGVKNIRVVDNLERGEIPQAYNEQKKVEFYNGDLRDSIFCNQVCVGIDIVFHCASKVGSISYYQNYSADVLSHNLIIDAQMLQSAQKSKVSTYVYISSAFVYPIDLMQEAYGPPIKETQVHPANPAISYGWAKLMGEIGLKYVVNQNNNFKGIILRLSNFYGKYQSDDFERGSIIPVLIKKSLDYPKLKPFSIFGEGQETRTYCHISDILDALCISVEISTEKKLIGPINVGSEQPIRIIDLTKKIISISGKKINIEHKLSSFPPVTMSQTLDCSKASELLKGWKPKVLLDEGLRQMFNYAKIKN